MWAIEALSACYVYVCIHLCYSNETIFPSAILTIKFNVWHWTEVLHLIFHLIHLI